MGESKQSSEEVIDYKLKISEPREYSKLRVYEIYVAMEMAIDFIPKNNRIHLFELEGDWRSAFAGREIRKKIPQIERHIRLSKNKETVKEAERFGVKPYLIKEDENPDYLTHLESLKDGGLSVLLMCGFPIEIARSYKERAKQKGYMVLTIPAIMET